jgi:predicted aspartyl protease
MVTAEDPFSHMYGGSSEFNVAAFSTTFDRRSFGRRIVAKINTNINEPTISADRSWAYLNFGSTHKHRFMYDTGASVSLITPQTFEHARQNGKVGNKWTGHGISIKNASGGEIEITGVYTIHFSINGRNMQAPFIVTKEATSNIIGMNVIKTYKLKMDVLTTRVTTALDNVASLQTSEEYDVKVHTDIKVEAGMSHLTKLFLQDKKSGKRLFGRHQFMVTVGPLAVAMVSDKDGVFELLIPNSTRYDVRYKRNDHMGEAVSLLNWTPIAKSEVGNWTEEGAAKVISSTQTRDSHKRRPHTAEDTEKIKHALDDRIREANIPYVERPQYREMLNSMSAAFSADKMDLGRTNIVESYIDLRDKEPVYTQQFRLPMEPIEFIKDNVMGWLDAGIFERAYSLYNSPIFCVPKKQGHGLRCVLDFRRLNLKTMDSKYSICSIDQCLEEVGKAGLNIFSCLDMRNGFGTKFYVRQTDTTQHLQYHGSDNCNGQ